MAKIRYILIALFILLPIVNFNNAIAEEPRVIIWRFDDISISSGDSLINRFVSMTENVTTYGGYVGWGFMPGYNETISYASPQNLTYTQENIDKFNDLTQDEKVFLWLHCWNHSWWTGQHGPSVWTKSIEEQREALNFTIWTFYNNFGYYPPYFSAGGSRGNVDTTIVLAERDILLLSGNPDYEPPDEDLRYLYLPSDTDSTVLDLNYMYSENILQEMKAEFTDKYNSYTILQVMIHPFNWNSTTLPIFAQFTDWVYDNHDLLNMDYTDAYNYKCDLESIPAKVTGLTVTDAKDGKLDLSWDASTEDDIDHYKIYRDGGFLTTVVHPTTSYQDTGLTNGQTYSYRVSAVDTLGNEGSKSNSAYGTPTSSQPQNQYTLTINTIGSGTVNKNPNQNTYTYGTIVTLTANPGSGCTFSHWSGDLTGSTNPTAITINSNKTVTATFTQNQKPIADLSAGEPYQSFVNTKMTFDGSESYDSDGYITNWTWFFGDNTTGNGMIVNHTYSKAGTYMVSLIVTDDKGANDSDSTTAYIYTNPVANTGGPYSGNVGQTINFNGSGSYDSDGFIVSYSWDFGDGGTGSDVLYSHAYASSGRFTVTLTVTDDDGATNTDTTTCVIRSKSGGGGSSGGGGGKSSGAAENKKPVADASAGEPYKGFIDSLITFDGSNSYDPDGTITSWTWFFGDDMTGAGKMIQHSYLKAGNYTVTLTVTDNMGATDTVTTVCIISQNISENILQNITQQNRPPIKPVIAGTINCSINTFYNFTVISSDPDNDAIQYTFYWGDLTTQSSGFLPNGTSYTVDHSWATSGPHTITVIVTDNQIESYSSMIINVNEVEKKPSTPGVELFFAHCALAAVILLGIKKEN